MASNKSIKKRNWAFVLYPESAPEDWKNIIQQSGLQCAISPLHNKDIDATGEPKKPHWHIIACYSGPTSFNVVKGLTDSLNAPIPIALEQVRGYYRYLTHKDNPEKVQYSDLDITTINGFSIIDFVELTKSEVVKIKRDIQSFIRDNDIYEYCDLMDSLYDISDWYEVASNNTYFFEKYVSSRRNKNKLFKSDDCLK